MSDENKQNDETSQSSDTYKNLKAEVDRKLGNITEELQKTQQMNAQLLLQLQQSQKASAVQSQPSTPEPSIGDLIYENPNKAAEIIKRQAKDEVLAQVRAEQQAQQRQADVISRLVMDYPELSDASNPLTKKAVERYTAMSEMDRQSPASYESAVLRAAVELGVKPRSQRESDPSDGFTLGSNQSRGDSKKAEEEADKSMMAFAQLLGVDVKSEDVKKRLKGRQRKNWLKYQ